MGEETADTLEVETEELDSEVVVDEPKLDENGDEIVDAPAEAEGLDLTLDEDTQPQDKKNAWVGKRLAREKKKIDAAMQGKTAAEQELEVIKEREKLKDLLIQQLEAKTQAPSITKPDVEQFDSVYDPEFVKQMDVYNESKLKQLAADMTKESTQKFVDTGAQDAQAKQKERDQVKHYERAFQLGVKDFPETEDKAMEYMGEENVKAIMSMFPETSQLHSYYFGKNETKAREMATLANSNRDQAILELGRLDAKLRAKVGSKSKTTTPEPDEPIEGSVNPKKTARGPKGAKYE